MAFAQLTYRESLRDIEACLSAQSAKLYHMGLRQETERSTLADANEARDWRIHAEFAQPKKLSRTFAPHPLQECRDRQNIGFHYQQLRVVGSYHLYARQDTLAGGAVLQMDQAASAHQKVLRQLRECCEVTNLDRRIGRCPRRCSQEAPQSGRFALH